MRKVKLSSIKITITKKQVFFTGKLLCCPCYYGQSSVDEQIPKELKVVNIPTDGDS